MAIRIRELKIKDFRGVRGELHLRFEDPRGEPLDRVVIAGVNGSGKTSVLEGILLALNRRDLFGQRDQGGAQNDHWRHRVLPGSVIDLDLHGVGSAHWPVGVRVVGAQGQEAPIRSYRWEKSLGRLVLEDFSFGFIEYFSSSRAPLLPGAVSPKLQGGRPAADTESNRLIHLKQRIVDERAKRAFVRSGGDARDAEWLRRLNEVWSAFHADESVIDADIVDPEDDDSGFDLFVFDGDARRCSIDQLSSGELEILTMAGSLILQDFDGLLLIDEPELHLHPEWQRGLLDALRAMVPNAQIILATHSAEIWDQAYSFERFFLGAPGDPRVVLSTEAESA